MNRKQLVPTIVLSLLVGGVSCAPPSMLVYSAGFTFSKYDYLVFGKSAEGQSTALYGMDVEVANLMARYNMKIIGDKEYPSMSHEDQAKTLFVRFAVANYNKKISLITISFDDAVSGKTAANVTSQAKGNLIDPSDRAKALETVSRPLIEALTHEKGLKVSATKNP